MDQTTKLSLPYILAAQSQKHVTHNEALRVLDVLVQLAVVDKDLNAPPGSPAEGDCYIVGPAPTGAWAGHAGAIAAYQDAAWAFYAPAAGWLAWVVDEDVLYAFDGTGWVVGGSGGLNPASLVGVNATADATNRLSVASPASLFSHEGAGHQLKINKATAGDTGSVLFQTGFSGRAEFGLAGDDDFHVKVSANGSAWHEGLVISRSDGGVRAKSGQVDLASAATCNIGAAAAQRVRVTGTTTITSFGTVPNELRFVHFAGALTLTHNATSLILPGAANIATEAGDSAVLASDASGNWRCLAYQRANGRALALSSFMATVLDDADAAAARATLGARMRHALSTTLADDTVATIAIGNAYKVTPIMLCGNAVGNPAGILKVRAAPSLNGVDAITIAGGTFNYYTTALTGTTGADGAVNFGADTAGNFYIENRIGYSAAFYVWAFEA